MKLSNKLNIIKKRVEKRNAAAIKKTNLLLRTAQKSTLKKFYGYC